MTQAIVGAMSNAHDRLREAITRITGKSPIENTDGDPREPLIVVLPDTAYLSTREEQTAAYSILEQLRTEHDKIAREFTLETMRNGPMDAERNNGPKGTRYILYMGFQE